MTLSGYGRLVSRIKELADLHAEGRLLALGGGGYNLKVVPTAWASAFQILKGEEVREYLPPSWSEFFRNEVGGTPLSPPDSQPKMDERSRDWIAEDLDRTLGGLRTRLTEIPGIF